MSDGVRIAISTKADGNMSMNWGEEKEVWANRERFLKKNDIYKSECVWTSLVGGDEVCVVSELERGKVVEADGFITDSANTALFMVTGDCLPTVIYAPDRKLVGLVHLGFRGVDKKLAVKVTFRMQEMGADLAGLEVFIGPGVRKETYLKYGKKMDEFWQITSPVNQEQWRKYIVEHSGGKYGLDLVGYVKQQLIGAGVLNERIEVSPIDTIADKNYFSHYRAGMTGEVEGRFATVVKLSGSL